MEFGADFREAEWFCLSDRQRCLPLSAHIFVKNARILFVLCTRSPDKGRGGHAVHCASESTTTWAEWTAACPSPCQG